MPEAAGERAPLLSGQSRQASTYSHLQAQDWKPTKKLRFIQAVTWINVFLTGFDSTVAASIYTTIASDFGAANNAVWVSTSYLITAVSFQALYGRMSDIYGRRAAFIFGTSIFSVGSLLCAISNSMLTLNLSRALTGVGGGGLMTMATIVLSDNVPFERRGLYQSANNLMYGLGGAFGASSGGIVAQYIGWRFIFLLQLPLSLAAVIGGAVLVKDPPVMPLPRDASVDVLGSITLVAAISSLLLALNMGGNEIEWSSATSIVLFLVAFILLGLFFWLESRATAPILPVQMLFGSKSTLSNISTNFFSGMAVYDFLFMVPLYFLGVLLEPTSRVGARLIVPAMGFPIGAIIAGYVMSKYGMLGPLVRIGSVILLIGALLPLTFSLDRKQSEAYYFFSLIPIQIGQGLVNPSSLFTMLAAFPHAEQAVATSAVYLCRNLGNVAGVALGSAILQNYLRVILPEVLKDIDGKDEIIENIRHSSNAIKTLPEEYRGKVTHVYGAGVKAALAVAAALAAIALISSYWADGASLKRQESTSGETVPEQRVDDDGTTQA